MTPWKTQCAPSNLPTGCMSIHGMSRHRPSVGTGVVLALEPAQGNVVHVLSSRGGVRSSGGSTSIGPGAAPLRGLTWLVLTGDDGNAQGERDCSARGEILRSLHDPQQRRRSASACSSIKDESLGSEDDQTPS